MDRAMVFGKYCLLERISVGGMAEVFRAKPLPARQSGKYLALKRILPHLAEDEEFITMFVDEAKLTVQLKHPNIVETYELGSFQNSHYILMEFIPGADVLSLQKRLREQRKIMSVAQACYLACKVARGLHYAHVATDEEGRPFNIIHRDVSPQNIRVTFDGRVKLIDFGIAKAAVQRTKTQVGVLKGKFGYMSPEQVHGEDIDHRSDVFALGTTLWEMLTNRRLFSGDNEFETLQMVKHPEIPPPSEKNGQVPPQVDDIVLTALAEDRNERYQTAEELADALEGFITGIREPYTRDHLANWMADTYSEELAEERQKRERFREIQTVDDVPVFNEQYADEPEEEEEEGEEEAVAGTAEVDTGPSDGETQVDEQVWDPDFAPDTEEEVDHEEFASNHTVVAAGGFDPENFEDETDEVMSLEEDDIVAVEEEHRGRGAAQSGDHPAGGAAPASGGNGRQQEVAPDQTVPVEGADTASMSAPPAAGSNRQSTPTPDGRGAPAAESAGSTQSRQAPVAEQENSFGTVKVAAAGAAVVALLGLVGALGYVLLSSDDGGEASGQSASGATSQMVVDVSPTPAMRGEIRVDGEKKGEAPPVTLSGLESGTHVVEADFPGFKPAEKSVELEPGRLENVEVKLESDPDAEGTLSLKLDSKPEGVEVFVDGARVEGDPGELGIDPGRHLVEVIADGHRAWSRVVDVAPGASVTKEVKLKRSTVSLKFLVDESATVTVDGEELGEAPVTAKSLDPSRLHTLELESLDGSESWSTKFGYPVLGRPSWRLSLEDPPESREDEDFGWITLSTGGDWWNVSIDGVTTGQRTPIGPDEKLPVEQGDRSLTLRRGGKMHELEIAVEGGETTQVELKRKFEWKPKDM